MANNMQTNCRVLGWIISTVMACTAPAQTLNLLNGSFELDTPVTVTPTGWSADEGKMYVTDGAGISPNSAYLGNNFLTATWQAPEPDDSFPDPAQIMSIYQTVDVGSYSSLIDGGDHYVDLSFAYNDGDAGDNGVVSLRFLDTSLQTLGGELSYSTDSLPTGGQEWREASLISGVPVGTRYVEVSLLAERVGAGSARNISFDAVSAELLDSLPPSPPRDEVRGNLIQFAHNGAWSWFQDERAIVDQQNQSVIVGYIANRGGVGGEAVDGHVMTSHFNLATGARSEYVHNDLESYGGGDDHNVPGLLKKSDGDILAVYAAHNRLVNTEDDRSYLRTFDADTGSWGPETEYHWWPEIPANAPGAGGTTYSNVFQLSAEDPDGDGNGRLYNIARTQQSPHIMYSDDNGATWEYGGQFTKQASDPPASSYVNGYYRYVSNGVDRVDFIATEFHPGDYNTSIYHAYFQGGKMYDSLGNEIDDDIFDAAQSFDPNKVTSTDDFTQVFQAGISENSRAWTTDIQRFNDGSIVALFKTRAGPYASSSGSTSSDHRVWYARFDPNTQQWSSHEIAKAGARLFGSQYDYTGLGAIHPHDPDVLYISTEIDPATDEQLGNHEIFKGVTNDDGATWTWTAITENSTYDNLRPIIPAWDENNTAVLWYRGLKSSSQNFDAAVVGIIDRKQETLGAITYIDAEASNTSLAVGGPLNASGPSPNPGATDGVWHQRTGFGNGGSVLTADESGAESVSMLQTEISGLEAGTYDIFAFFWSEAGQDWRFEAGLDSDNLELYRNRGAQQAEADHFSVAPVVDEGTRSLYRAYLGRVAHDGGQPIKVFIDDSNGDGSQRVWYDGVGHAVVAAALPGDYNADGSVDARDYAVWRERVGEMTPLPNDPIGGTIGVDQFEQWRANYGSSLPSTPAPDEAADPAPEPTSAATLFMVLMSSPYRAWRP